MNTATGFKTPEINWEASDLREKLENSKQYCDLILSGPRSRRSAKEVASFVMLSIGRIKKIETYNNYMWEDAEDSKNL